MVHLGSWNGRMTDCLSPTLSIETDASLRGWGALCQGIGCWKSLHINILELLAVFYAMKAFFKTSPSSLLLVLILSNDTSVVAHVNRMGGT